MIGPLIQDGQCLLGGEKVRSEVGTEFDWSQDARWAGLTVGEEGRSKRD